MKSVIFMGTPEFSAPILQSLVDDKNYDVIAAVTQPDRKVGRKHILTPSPVKKVAVQNDIKVYQPEKLSGSEELQELIALNADLIVTAAFGQFLPMSLIDSVKIAAVNVHASLLPQYRGGAPVHYAIMNGDKETGVTIIYMVKKMDAGKMLASAKIPITSQDDVGTMFDKLSLLGRDLLMRTLPDLVDGKVQPLEQDETKVSFSPNISPEQEEIDINLPARLVDAKVRGLRPFPVAYVIMEGKRTKLWKTSVIDRQTDLRPGQIVEKSKHELLVATGSNGVISIEELQPAGKQKMTITDYLNGVGENLHPGKQIIDNDRSKE